MRKLLFISVMMLLACHVLSAEEAVVTARIEQSHRDDYGAGYIFPMKERGMLFQSLCKKSDHGQRFFRTEYYDTNLNLVFVDSVLVDKNMEVDNQLYEKNVNYTILREKRGEDFIVVSFDPATHQTRVIDGEYTRKGSMRNLIIADDYMVFSSTQRKTDRIGIFNLTNGEARFADIHFDKVRDKDIFIMENTVIDNMVNALVRVKEDVYLVRIDMQGNKQKPICITSAVPQNILTASVSKAGGKYFVTGTYTDKKKNDKAQGIYFGQLDGDYFAFIKFFNFLDLNNFTEYMSEKAQKKVERRKEKAEKQGKAYSMDYLIASHNIIEHNGYYYYLGEAFNPTYSYVPTGRMGAMRVFDGYYYTHAVLVKFDNQGNIMWDNCFEMKPRTRPFYVKLFINAGFKDGHMNAMFVDNKNIVSKSFDETTGLVVSDRKAEVLETDDEAEDIKKTRSSNAQHWYGDNFLVYGDQVVKNNDTGKRRRVYFINKYTIK